jgi:hypothetical protein
VRYHFGARVRTHGWTALHQSLSVLYSPCNPFASSGEYSPPQG